MKTKVSLAIITKQRLAKLERCLNTVQNQIQIPDKIILIDNDAKKSAKKIIKKFPQLNFSYYYCAGTVPRCRNLALKKATTQYLAFVDDDCLLDEDWLKYALATIKKEKATFCLGKTKLFNPQNIFALAQHARDNYWKNYNGQIFDTKNVLLNLKTIKNKKLKFDENCQQKAYDSADFDFDFQTKKAKLKKAYCPKMILYHEETDQWRRFKKRAFYRGFLAKYLDKKWQLNDSLVDLRSQNLFFFWLQSLKKFPKEFKHYQSEMNSPIYKKIIATLFIKIFERQFILGYVANQKN